MKILDLIVVTTGSWVLMASTPPPEAAKLPAADATAIARPDVAAMSLGEIRRFNDGVPVKHRYYIICRKEVVTGFLAKVRRICQTREDWQRSREEAQQTTQSLIDGGRASSGRDPMCPDCRTH